MWSFRDNYCGDSMGYFLWDLFKQETEMKRIKRDFISAFFVIFPALILMAPLVFDVLCELNKRNATRKEPVRIEYSMPDYGYNPYINKEEMHTVYIMRTVAYCSCEKCCGWNTGITYSGTIATQGRTVAANLDKFPIGTRLIIDGNEYTVEDTGNLSENMIDIYFDNHNDAIKYGSQWKAVEVVAQ